MPKAAAQAFSIVELVESILQLADCSDIYRFLRVNKFLRNTILGTRVLREALLDHLYYPPNEAFANVRMIKTLPPKVMRNGEYLAICVRVEQHKGCVKAASIPDKDVSWRLLQTSIPDVQKLTGLGPCCGAGAITATSKGPLTLGDLYEVVVNLTPQHKTCATCEKKGYLEVHFARLS